jgi:mono/diheme cytochrome c family protein
MSDAAPSDQPPGPALEGALLYRRHGCVNCHGPNGLGGVSEPAVPGQGDPAALGHRLLHIKTLKTG